MIRLLAVVLLAVAWCAEPTARTVRTPHFEVKSDADAAATAQVAQDCERVFSALSAWIGAGVRPLPRDLPRLPVLLFADRPTFQAYARGNARNVATAHAEGYYSGTGRIGDGTLVLFRDGGRELGTLRHELVHYCLDLLLPPRAGAPVWFNEGLAVVAEDAWIDPGAVRPARVPLQRISTLFELARGDGLPLASITGLGAEAWLADAGSDRAAADRRYTAAYGAVLYLLNHSEATRRAYWDLLRRMVDGADHDTAWKATVGRLDVDATWRTWVLEGCWQAARQADPTATAAAACEHGWSWVPDNHPPGDPAQAGRWLVAGARGFAQIDGYELDAAEMFVEAGRVQAMDPPLATTALVEARRLFAGRGHEAGVGEAWLAESQAWGQDEVAGADWRRAAEAAAQAVAVFERVGPRRQQAAALVAQGLCYLPGRLPAADAAQRAIDACDTARRIYHDEGETVQVAAITLLMSQAAQPAEGRVGDWRVAASLAVEARTMLAALPKPPPADIARSWGLEAITQRRDRNPAGDWARAWELYRNEAGLLPDSDVRGRARNALDQAACAAALGDPRAAALYAQAGAASGTAGDGGLVAYSSYQEGISLMATDPQRAAEAFARAAAGYASAGGKEREWSMALTQQAVCLAQAKAPVAQIRSLYRDAAAIEARRGDGERLGWCLYQQAWFGEPARNPGGDAAAAAALYRDAAQAWNKASLPEKAATAQQQRARLLLPSKGAANGWEEAARAWGEAATALAALPETPERLADRGSAFHQRAWCLIRGDGSRMTPEARRAFAEAVRLLEAAGDRAGADVSRSWIKDR